MDFAADFTALYADFGTEAILRRHAGGAPVTGRVILDRPGAALFGGELSVTDYSLRYPTATFPEVAVGDRFTLGRTDYTVREIPQPSADGLEATVALALN